MSAHETPVKALLSSTLLGQDFTAGSATEGNMVNVTVLEEDPLEIRPLRTTAVIQRDRLSDKLHFNSLRNQRLK